MTNMPKRILVKGIGASPGITTGSVVIAFDPSEAIERFELNKDPVLVTSMTDPNWTICMRKAKAIVTNTGGVLSHAAIVSREMGIPCIVGTKVATSVFKDGDYVEVDTHRGIVRKVAKEEYEKRIKEPKTGRRTETSRARQKIRETGPGQGLIMWFKDVDKKDLPLVGGKGANLGEMFNKFPIPNGFCITVNAYKRFLKKNELEGEIFALLNRLDAGNTEELETVSRKLQRLIMMGKIPEGVRREILGSYRKLKEGSVAVRSSATAEDLPAASFAGQQSTFLNVKGEKALLEVVKKCWASLFTARAIYYRVVGGFGHEKVLIAVVVQKMVDSAKAGVMFSANPVNRNKDEILIEGSYGLGEAVVSGKVNPDAYIVDKKTLKIKEKRINEKKIAIVRDSPGKIKLSNWANSRPIPSV